MSMYMMYVMDIRRVSKVADIADRHLKQHTDHPCLMARTIKMFLALNRRDITKAQSWAKGIRSRSSDMSNPCVQAAHRILAQDPNALPLLP
jgi:hypothetical protein